MRSITQWFTSIRDGRESALPPEDEAKIYGAVFDRARELAKNYVRVREAESIATDALHAIVEGALKGKHEQVSCRAQLFALIRTVVVRERINRWRKTAKERPSSTLATTGDDRDMLAKVADRSRTPAELAVANESVDCFVSRLTERQGEMLGLLLLGFDPGEIRQKTRWSLATIYRDRSRIADKFAEFRKEHLDE